MTMACSDINFHKKLSAKYRPGRRGRGRWPQMFYFRAGQGGRFGKIMIRLAVRLPKTANAAVMVRDRVFVERIHALQQGIRLLSQSCNFVYRTALDQSNRLRPVRDDRSHLHNRPKAFAALDPVRWRPACRATALLDKFVTAAPRPSAPPFSPAADRLSPMPPQGTAIPFPFRYRAARRPHLRHDAGSPGPVEKKVSLQGLMPPAPVRSMLLYQRIRRPENRAGHGTDLFQLVHRMDSPVVSLTRRASSLSALQKKRAAKTLLPERTLTAVYPGRRPASAPGLFLKKGETAAPAAELVFKSRRNIESEFKELKKIVTQVSENIAQPFPVPSAMIQTEIRKQIDMERISDQVYRTIERRIRQERERRGL